MKRVLPLALFVLIAVVLSGPFGPAAGAEGGIAGSAGAIKSLAGCSNSSIPANDDGSSAAVSIGFSVNFFGQTYTSVFVNNNGNVTFDDPLPAYTPFNLLSTTQVIIAPFFADVDTRGSGSGLVTYGRDTLGGHAVFCVNWIDVGYYNSNTDKLNSFQLLLVERPDQSPGDFDMMFNYHQIRWETGDASDGTDGLGGFSARVGYSNGVETAFELPGSAVPGSFLDSSGSALVTNSRNSIIPGRYVFQVRNGTAPTGGSIKGTVFGPEPGGSPTLVALPGALVQICQTGGACITTTTNDVGRYSISPLPAGEYYGTALPPPDRPDLFPGSVGPVRLPDGGNVPNVDFTLTRPRALPSGVTVQSIAQTSTGAPVINWNTTTQITIANDPGCTASFQLVMGGQVLDFGSMTEVSPGVYKGTIVPLRPAHGPAVLRFTVNCPDPDDSKVVEADVYIDPSGTVRTVGGDPIAGATVTLYRSDDSSGPFEQVPDGSAVMSPSNRNNPDLTDAEGYFHWDVIAGYYKVRAQKAGCHAPGDAAQAYVETGVLTIPPPVTDLDLRLECAGGPVATPTPTRPAGTTPTPTRRPPTPVPTPSGAPEGDANCDGSVNSIDSAIVLQVAAGLVSAPRCPEAADVNDDGSVNSIDAALILQYVAGLLPRL